MVWKMPLTGSYKISAKLLFCGCWSLNTLVDTRVIHGAKSGLFSAVWWVRKWRRRRRRKPCNCTGKGRRKLPPHTRTHTHSVLSWATPLIETVWPHFVWFTSRFENWHPVNRAAHRMAYLNFINRCRRGSKDTESTRLTFSPHVVSVCDEA